METRFLQLMALLFPHIHPEIIWQRYCPQKQTSKEVQVIASLHTRYAEQVFIIEHSGSVAP